MKTTMYESSIVSPLLLKGARGEVGLANARGSRIAARMYFILPVVVVVVVVIGKGSLDIREREMYRRKRRMKGG